MDTNLQNIKQKIRNCLSELYTKDTFLFERNNGEGVGERCITFRFAMYLQGKFHNYYVDVEYDNSMTYSLGENGSVRDRNENKGKPMRDSNGIEHNRIPDIIIHKRDLALSNDYLCFELKKWNRIKEEDVKKDYDVLKDLTSNYGHAFGFHIIFGKEKKETKWTIFQYGGILEDKVQVFRDAE